MRASCRLTINTQHAVRILKNAKEIAIRKRQRAGALQDASRLRDAAILRQARHLCSTKSPSRQSPVGAAYSAPDGAESECFYASYKDSAPNGAAAFEDPSRIRSRSALAPASWIAVALCRFFQRYTAVMRVPKKFWFAFDTSPTCARLARSQWFFDIREE